MISIGNLELFCSFVYLSVYQSIHTLTLVPRGNLESATGLNMHVFGP